MKESIWNTYKNMGLLLAGLPTQIDERDNLDITRKIKSGGNRDSGGSDETDKHRRGKGTTVVTTGNREGVKNRLAAQKKASRAEPTDPKAARKFAKALVKPEDREGTTRNDKKSTLPG